MLKRLVVTLVAAAALLLPWPAHAQGQFVYTVAGTTIAAGDTVSSSSILVSQWNVVRVSLGGTTGSGTLRVDLVWLDGADNVIDTYTGITVSAGTPYVSGVVANRLRVDLVETTTTDAVTVTSFGVYASIGEDAAAADDVELVEAFAVVEAALGDFDTSCNNFLSVDMPAGVQEGELLLAFITLREAVAGSTTLSTSSSGWVEVEQLSAGGTQGRFAVFGKIATATNTLQVTDNGFDGACASVSLRISSHGVTDPAADIVKGPNCAGTSATPDPGCIATDAVESRKWLWVEAFGADGLLTTTPYESTGYTPAAQQTANGANPEDAMTAVAWLQSEAQTEEPAPMAMSGSEEWRAKLYAVPPALVPANNDDR